MDAQNSQLRGSLRKLILFDVGESFNMDKIRSAIGPRGVAVKRSFPRRTPDSVQYGQAPIVERVAAIRLSTGEELACTLKYYEYAVVVVQVEIPFACDWESLIRQVARWIDSDELENHAREVAERRVREIAPDRQRPRERWLQEEYLVTEISNCTEPGCASLTAADLLDRHRDDIARLLRGEEQPISPKAADEIVDASLSYAPTDLVVAGASSALVFDRTDDLSVTTAILEYAKMQLLEFRYYDELMTRLLSEVYDALEKKRNPLFSRWTLPRDAERVNTIRLDVMELTERVDNAIKFVSDAFYARVYRMASQRTGVQEYRALVDEKLKTVGELYQFMVDQFDESRSFVLEVAVAILALLDVILLLRGK
jgi:hypothetical protein